MTENEVWEEYPGKSDCLVYTKTWRFTKNRQINITSFDIKWVKPPMGPKLFQNWGHIWTQRAEKYLEQHFV